ncbi:MAG: tRNA preQ1(34) S-adenosylmethionine ribosyltransferase-isomerase QueA [Prochlorococcus sp. SP3034]|nr:tRNA preQ1(34) S-adenosylmethionine ribosyltransferase-isomerase QueA [Prochlorococcus sp. SP3034]
MNTSKEEIDSDYNLNSYDYKLNTSLIANKPSNIRHQSRMMVVNDMSSLDSYSVDKLTLNIIDELNPGDAIIINDTKVMKARIYVELESGSIVELLVLELIRDSIWLCLAKPAKKLKINKILKLNSQNNKSVELKVVGIHKDTGGRLIEFPNHINDLLSMSNFLAKYGQIPLPPYITNEDSLFLHEETYQTRYAKNPGAIAAPTAGLHLSDFILSELTNKGVKILPITLHVGYGTFKPIDKVNLIDLKLHKEFVNVDQTVINEIKDVKRKGKKIIAIGTTSVRALESCYCSLNKDILPISKNVDLVIKPGFKFRVVDGLLTNFHLPKSSLLLLVSAIIGRKRLLDLYRIAIREKFRFFSYGDAMYITPEAFLREAKFKP